MTSIVVGLIVFSLTISGCATLFRLENRKIRVDSIPSTPGIKIAITHPQHPLAGETPMEINSRDLHRDSTIRVTEPCYETTEVSFEIGKSKAASLNIFNLGIGFLVDYANGALWQYRDTTAVPVLKKPLCDPNADAAASFKPLRGQTAWEADASGDSGKDDAVEQYGSVLSAEGLAEQQSQGVFQYLLHRLGAVRFKYIFGSANIKSFVRREDEVEEIANGNEWYQGYEISFQTPDSAEGWSYSLIPRYLNQSIMIADFREGIKSLSLPGTETIPVVVTDFETGLVVDPSDPNTYVIHLSSWGVIAESQFNWVQHCKIGNCALFFNFVGGFSLLEEITMDVEFGSDAEKSTNWKWAKSFYAGLTLGTVQLLLPKSSFQISYNYLRYPSLKLPRSIEFRDKTAYNSDKQVFERKRVFLDEVELEVHTLSLTYTFIF